MIRLDAATVLLQWAAGGLFFLWFTTRRREVGIGYGWLMRGIFVAMAAAAAWLGFRFDSVALREASSLAVVAGGSVALAVSIARRAAGVAGEDAEHDRRSERVAAMTGIQREGRLERAGAGTSGAADGGTAPSRRKEFPPMLDLIAPVVAVLGLLAAGFASAGREATPPSPCCGCSPVQRSSAR